MRKFPYLFVETLAFAALVVVGIACVLSGYTWLGVATFVCAGFPAWAFWDIATDD